MDTATLNLENVQTYQLVLDWVKENGVLVTPHIYGTALLTVKAGLNELGLDESDPRAKRLQGLRRKLVTPHLCAHHVFHEKGDTILGYSPNLPKPPTVFFTKVHRLRKIQYLTPTGWITFPTRPYQLDTAINDDDGGVISKWIDLTGDFDWPIVDHAGQPGRWLRLKWDDLGVREFSDRDLIVYPTNSLSSLESRARASVDINNAKGIRGYGQKLVGYGGYAWIGFKAWAAWQRDWQRYEAEMDCIKAYILWRYPEFEADIRAELEEIAGRAWKSLSYFGYAEEEAEQAFTETMVKTGLARIPSPAVIQSRLRLDYEVALVQAESDVERDRLESERLRAEQVEEQARQAAAREWANAEQWQAWATAERVETEQRAMRMAAMEKARKQIEEAGSPLQQMADNLRHTVYRKLREAQKSLKERGSLHPKTVQGLRMLVEQFALLNSHGDDVLEQQLQAFEKMMPAAGGVKNEARLGNIQAMVDDITTLTKEAAERVMERNVADDFGTDSVRW